MSESNVLEKFLADASKQIDKKKREKAPPLNGAYRNHAWYMHLFKSIGADEAFDVVTANIKNKSFSHEPKIAIAAYREFYNREFQSKDEREAVAQKNEIERLRAEVEELKKKKAELGGEVDDSADDSTGFAPPAGLTQEQFKPIFYEWFEKSQGHKPTGGSYLAAWRTYNKNNEIQA